MLPHRETLVALLAFVVSTAALASERTWTSSDGRTMRAEFVREVDGDVTFIKDGKLVTIPIDKLSAADQQIVRDLAAGRPVEEQAPADNPFQPVDRPPQEAENPFQVVDDSNATPDRESVPDDNPFKVSGNQDTADESAARRETAVTPRETTARDRPRGSKPKPASIRTWTDKRGQQSKAKFVRMHNGNAVLMRGTRPLSVPFYDLSEADQQYLRDFLAASGDEDQIPPPPPTRDSQDGTAVAGGASPAMSPVGPGAGIPRGPRLAAGPHFPGPRGFPSGPGFAGGGFSSPSTPSFSPPESPPVASAPDFGSGTASPLERMQQQQQDMLARMAEERVRMQEQRVEAMRKAEEKRQQEWQELQRQREQQRQNEIVAECLSCKGQLTKAQADGKKCPHCGVTWDYEIDEFGQRRQINNAKSPFGAPGQPLDERTKARVARIVLGAFVVVGLIIVGAVVLFIVVIVAAVNSRKPQQYPYNR